MYIDTHTKERMEESICNLFNMHPLELYEQLLLLDRSSKDENDFENKLDFFISEKSTIFPDEILLFHFSRRLKGSESETEGRTLADLLLSESQLSAFLKENGIEFSKGDQHIEVIYKGRVVDWDKCWYGNPGYMKLRLGYYKGREDFCFNGFAFKDLLYRNNYARELSGVPEFLGQLVECLQCDSVGWRYMENSEYFCYEYKLPLSVVMLDDYDHYSDSLKQRCLLRCVLQRLHKYQILPLKYMFDHDNPPLRLADNYTIPPQYYVGREKITAEMLRY